MLAEILLKLSTLLAISAQSFFDQKLNGLPTSLVVFFAAVLLGLELLSVLGYGLGHFLSSYVLRKKELISRGIRLDALSPKDIAFIVFNRLTTPFFAYHFFCLAWRYASPGAIAVSAPNAAYHIVNWSLYPSDFFLALLPFEMAIYAIGYLAKQGLQVACIFVIYDLFYTSFHALLHEVRFLYVYVHKHHHRQHAPFRGNFDAVNVHPFEFLVGEYLHTFALFLFLLLSRAVKTLLGQLLNNPWAHLVVMPDLHIVSLVCFLISGAILTAFNHTRFDISFPLLPSFALNALARHGPASSGPSKGLLTFLHFSVSFHDLHHWQPKKNFGQYIVLWDALLFNSFQAYPRATSIPTVPTEKAKSS